MVIPTSTAPASSHRDQSYVLSNQESSDISNNCSNNIDMNDRIYDAHTFHQYFVNVDNPK